MLPESKPESSFDSSFDPYFTRASSVCYGGIVVVLGKRRPSVDYPCAEILYVTLDDHTSESDIRDYIRFHVSYTMHRVRNAWPHQYGMVYDSRRYKIGSNVPALIEKTFDFIMMHSNLGEHYKTWLHAVGVVLDSETTVNTLNQILATFGPQTKPVVVHMPTDSHSLAERMR